MKLRFLITSLLLAATFSPLAASPEVSPKIRVSVVVSVQGEKHRARIAALVNRELRKSSDLIITDERPTVTVSFVCVALGNEHSPLAYAISTAVLSHVEAFSVALVNKLAPEIVSDFRKYVDAQGVVKLHKISTCPPRLLESTLKDLANQIDGGPIEAIRKDLLRLGEEAFN